MAPKISPNKTWIGFAGGTIAVIVGGVIFRYCVAAATWPQWAGLVVVTAAAVPLGDLSESAMKRDLGVKDTGTLIPGHGGIMDRFDSWVFVAPVAYVYITRIAGGF
jgi:phosphatidate cytidylyltransferase